MKQLVKNNKSGKISVMDTPIPGLANGELLVKNIFSAVSLGTEKAQMVIAKKNLLEKAKSRPDDFKKVLKLIDNEGIYNAYKKSMAKLNLPSHIGYSSVGQVIKSAKDVKNFSKGDIVACGGVGHAEIISVKKHLCCKVPKSVALEEAAFTTIAAIAMQGVRQSNASIGENIGVIGLGLIGIITIKILEASGCNAYGIDIDSKAVEKGKKLGLSCFDRSSSTIEQNIFQLTDGYGLDSVIITAATKSNDPIEFSSEISRDKGNIIVVGDVKTDLPRKNFYNKELSLHFSRSYGPGRYDRSYENKGNDYPIGFVRWTENRNMISILNLLESKTLSFEDLDIIKIPFLDSPKFYEKLSDGEIENPLILEYDEIPILNKTIVFNNNKSSVKEINVGIIGAGNYAQNFFIPLLKKFDLINIEGIVSHQGTISKHIASKYGFHFASTDPEKILSNPDINTVFILTRHDSHADYVIRSLAKDKHVFVEKPLALNIEDLVKIKHQYATSKGSLVVGYNRRYSDHIIRMQDIFSDRKVPLSLNIMINAGKLNSEHWVHDLEVGGGRIIGEMCHFVDLSKYIVNSSIVDMKSFTLEANSLSYKDTVATCIKFLDGSIANISYYSNGINSYPKERIEVFGDGKIVVIEDFKQMIKYTQKGKQVTKSRYQDKGHEKLISKFFDSITSNKKLMDIDELVETSKLMFEI